MWFDVGVADTPPSIGLTDALGLAPHVSRVIVVVEGGRTNASDAAHVIHSLHQVGAKVAGMILNKARSRDSAYHHDHRHDGTAGNSRMADGGSASGLDKAVTSAPATAQGAR